MAATGGGDELLSRRLSHLALQLREYEGDGVLMEPLAVQSLVAILDRAALDAGELERLVVPGAARLTGETLPPDVVPLHPETPA